MDDINSKARETADVIKNGSSHEIQTKLREEFNSMGSNANAKAFSKTLQDMNAADCASSNKYLPTVSLTDERTWSEYAKGEEKRAGVTVTMPSPIGQLYNHTVPGAVVETANDKLPKKP